MRNAIGIVAIGWALGLLLAVSCAPSDARTQVYLESETDLGNGYKNCNYSEGVVRTIPAHQLCPLTIEVD